MSFCFTSDSNYYSSARDQRDTKGRFLDTRKNPKHHFPSSVYTDRGRGLRGTVNVTDRMRIQFLLLIPERRRRRGRRKEERTCFYKKRANCTINHEAPSCLQWISPVTDSFSALRKLRASNRATPLIMRQCGLDFKQQASSKSSLC